MDNECGAWNSGPGAKSSTHTTTFNPMTVMVTRNSILPFINDEPSWNNTNRINKANQFNPRPINVRPNLSTARNTFKTGRVNVNTGHGNINSGSVHVNAGTQNKSGSSRVNTGKQNVNTARVNRPVLSNQTSQVNLRSPQGRPNPEKGMGPKEKQISFVCAGSSLMHRT
ncbi:hypothetical protein Tco_1319801 [Tanacetum coccineum]